MSTTPTKVLLFGDGTVDPVACVKQLSRDAKRFPSLDAFLRITAFALRSELARSTSPSRRKYPRFTSISGLAEWYEACNSPQVTVFPVLLCIAQVGVLLREYELNPGILDVSETRPAYCIGLCNGMIAAAAAASCTSVADLLAVGPRLVCLNLRLMFAAVDRSKAIDDGEETWTIVTPGFTTATHDKLIAEYIESKGGMPVARQPYISAESETVTTISGPPSTLAEYLESADILRKATKINTPINAAYHASHLEVPDLGFVLGDDPIWKLYPVKKGVRVMSIHTGDLIQATNLASLLLHSIGEVLSKRFRWGTVLKCLPQQLRAMCTQATVVPIGPDRVSGTVEKALRAAGIDVVATGIVSAQKPDIMPFADDIAIVGVAARLPGAEELQAIWDLLKDGRDTCTEVPTDRFDLSDHHDPSGKQPNTTSVPYGCFVERPGVFDAKLFNMSPREASQTDPMQRLALLTTYEALEMAGYSPNTLPSFDSERVGTFWGQTIDDYRETNACQSVDIYYVSGGVRAFGPGRMNYHFKWEGPSMSVDTACSSSALSVQLAVQSLRSGECDLAVAGGANIITGSDMYAGLARGGFLSKTGQCKTFDDAADGYCRGDGVGSVVLKRLQDAARDHDNVLAVIKSSSTNHSAFAASITRPDSTAQAKVMRQVLRDACVEPHEVDYVEMHGTGTQAGDAAEFASVTQVFCQGRDRTNPLHVGSIKANVGHGEAAAGINSLVKVILMLKENAIPPHVGIRGTVNSKFAASDLEVITINRTLRPFKRRECRPRRVFLNSFNATGGNTAMLIEDAPVCEPRVPDVRSSHVIAVSGRTQKSFTENRENLLKYLQKNNKVRIADVGYTTTARRIHHGIRSCYVAQDLPQLVEQLGRDVTAAKKPSQVSDEPKLVFTFTGQGSHYVDMARRLFVECTPFRRKLITLENICRNQGLPQFMNLIRDDTPGTSHTEAEFQLSIIAIQMALVSTLDGWDIKPAAVIGHSIGEYAALVAAGVLNEADALYLIGSRAMQIEKTCTPGEYSMLAVSSTQDSLEDILSEIKLSSCVVACQNSPTSQVVSGNVEDLARLTERLAMLKVLCKPVNLPFGFHSPQMRAVGGDLRKLGTHVRFSKPIIPIASTLLGRVVQTSGIFNGDYLASQTTEAVKFSLALKDLSKHLGGAKNVAWLEIGTHPICGPMISSTLEVAAGQISHILRRNKDPWSSISRLAARVFDLGVKVDWASYHRDHLEALSVVELPRYSFDLQNHWIPYRNSWRLYKGEGRTEPSVPMVDPQLAPFHYMRHQEITAKRAKVQLACDLSSPELLEMINGHLVEGVGLCPSSVYAHLAYHAATMTLGKALSKPNSSPSFDLGHMDIISPLTVTSTAQLSTILVSVDWDAREPQLVKVAFASATGSSEKTHCRCVLTSGHSTQWRSEWQENEYLIQSRIDLLKDTDKRQVYTIYHEMLYSLFASAIVKYSPEYQIIHRMYIDYELDEATAELRIPESTVNKSGSPGPFCLDALMHMAGFILNSSPKVSSDTVFIASGWKGLQMVEPLRPGSTYICHTRMRAENGQPNVFCGNVSVFSGAEMIGSCRGLKFHRLKRSSLQKLLGTPKDGVKSPQSQISRPEKRSSLPPKVKSTPPPSPPTITDHEPAADDNTIENIMGDISEETGVSVGDLSDDTTLSELGIDSILSISLIHRFKERTGTELPVNTFSVCDTIRSLKEFLMSKLLLNSTTSPPPVPKKGTKATPKASPKPSRVSKSPAVEQNHNISDEPLKSEILCTIIAEEVGIAISDVQSASTISELGVDSILILSITHRFKDATGDDLGARFFYDNPTLAGIISKLDGTDGDEPPNLTEQQQQLDDTPDSDISSDSGCDVATPPSEPSPPPALPTKPPTCVSMLLQGSSSSTGPALFFLPDGSGSLFSYVHLPPLREELAVYALDSPFHKNPSDYTLGFAAVAEIYVSEIRRLRPKGPYMVGGWSLGGVHAYEVARQLIAAGEIVEKLIMIDSPCPGTLPPLPHASLDLLEKAGIFQGLSKEVGKVKDHTREHFVRVTDAFQHWDYRALNRKEREGLKGVVVVWGRFGVLEDDEEANSAWVPGMDRVDADMMKAKEWLTGKRTKFDDGGWEALVGMEVEMRIVGGNHFSLMFPPVVTELGETLREVLSE